MVDNFKLHLQPLLFKMGQDYYPDFWRQQKVYNNPAPWSTKRLTIIFLQSCGRAGCGGRQPAEFVGFDWSVRCGGAAKRAGNRLDDSVSEPIHSRARRGSPPVTVGIGGLQRGTSLLGARLGLPGLVAINQYRQI